MAGARLGLVTFGHSGGTELGRDLAAALPGWDIREQGLLDDVAEETLRSWRAGPDSPEGTVVHLRDGRELTIESAPLLARVVPALDRLAAVRPQVVLYGCAGPLPAYPEPAGALSVRPRQVLEAFVAAAVPRGRVGVIVPSPLHLESARRDYSGPERIADCRAVSPADRASVLAAVAALSAGGADTVVLGCFDHPLRDLRAARKAAGRPVVSSRQLAFDAVSAAVLAPVVTKGPLACA